MRNVLATDIKNNIRSIRFILGIFLIVSATLMSEHEMLQKIINAGGSAEGPGWFVAYTYCMNSVNMLLFVPIAVAFAGGENTEAELHSRFFLFSYIRSGRKQYLVGKAAGLLVSGGLTAFLAMVFLLVICILRFGQYPSLIDGNYEMAVLVGRTAVSFLRLFLNGAFWALIGGTSAVITKNRYMSDMYPEFWTHIYKLGGHHGCFSVFYRRHPFCFCLDSFVIIVINIFINSNCKFFK